MFKKNSLVRSPGFAWLWGGQTFSTFGSQISGVAIAYLAVTVLNASAFEVSLLSAAGTISFLLVGLIAGAWVDRWVKRRVMIVADLIRMVAVGVIPLLWAFDALQVWHVIVVGFVMGLATVFFDVSYQSFVPVILPSDKIAAGNSALETTNQTAGIAGPGLVGWLLTLVKAPVLLAFDSLTYLVSALTLTAIKDTEKVKPKSDRRPLPVEIREGLAFIGREKLIRRITMTTATNNLFSSLMWATFPLVFFGVDYLNISPALYGIMGSAAAVGSLIGATTTTRLIKWLGEGTVISVSALAGGLVTVLLPVAVGMHNEATVPLLIVMEFLIGFTVLAYNITQVSARQRICPPELLGRMNASIRFFVWGVMPIGATVGGAIATAYSPLTSIIVGSVGAVFSSVFVLFSPLTRMRKLPERAAEAS